VLLLLLILLLMLSVFLVSLFSRNYSRLCQVASYGFHKENSGIAGASFYEPRDY